MTDGNGNGSPASNPPLGLVRPAYTVGQGKPPLETRWRPGQSGNPSGKPALAKYIDRFAGKDGRKIVEGLAAIAFGDDEDRRVVFGESFRVTAQHRLEALRDLADRRFGKPTPSNDDEAGATGVTLNILIPVPR